MGLYFLIFILRGIHLYSITFFTESVKRGENNASMYNMLLPIKVFAKDLQGYALKTEMNDLGSAKRRRRYLSSVLCYSDIDTIHLFLIYSISIIWTIVIKPFSMFIRLGLSLDISCFVIVSFNRFIFHACVYVYKIYSFFNNVFDFRHHNDDRSSSGPWDAISALAGRAGIRWRRPFAFLQHQGSYWCDWPQRPLSCLPGAVLHH